MPNLPGPLSWLALLGLAIIALSLTWKDQLMTKQITIKGRDLVFIDVGLQLLKKGNNFSEFVAISRLISLLNKTDKIILKGDFWYHEQATNSHPYASRQREGL